MRAAFLALLALALVSAGAASGASTANDKKPKTVPGELIVGFKSGVSDAAQAQVLDQAGAKQKKKFKQIHAQLANVPDSKLESVQKALSSDPRVSFVEPNYVVSALVIPNDPSFGDLWGMNNTGQTGGTADADIDAPEAWDLEQGSSNVVVASIDTGVDFTHPDLATQQWVNTGENCGSSDATINCAQRSDGVDNDNDGYVDDWRGWNFIADNNDPTDDNAHGTHTSGTLGAAGNNGIGVAGVDWNAKIMALKFLDSTGNGTNADAISAILYAADHGARVANNSWGGSPFDPALLNAIEYGGRKGVLFDFAAGNGDPFFGFGLNTDTDPQYPSAFDSDAILAVAATDDSDNLAFFSNYGLKTVDLGAPGVNVLSTTPGNTYQAFDGTSMATPHVSGAAALVMSHYPGATLYGTKALLMRTVDPTADLTGNSVSGGRLNVFNAVSCSNAPVVLLSAPTGGFVASLGDPLPIRVIGANCASPAGLSNVTVTVNGSPVSLAAASPSDTALYTGTYTPTTAGTVTVTASVSVGGTQATQSVSGTAVQNYSCTDVPDTFVDARPGGKVSGGASDSDDGHTLLNISFPFTYYGQSYSQVTVSSNGFLELGSTAGSNEFDNASIPSSTAPNSIIPLFWDDLNPQAAGDVYAGVAGTAPNRRLYVEWFGVPHYGGSGTGTFEVSLSESTGEIRYHWLDTDFGNGGWNNGADATAGVENQAGTLGRQISFKQPLLTTDRAVSCTPSAPPPPAPSITTTSLADATNGQAYNKTLAATGGTPPYTWSLASGSLPSGLSLDSSTGVISGTPSAAPGTFSFVAKVTDSASQPGTKSLSITVADQLSVTTTSLSGGTVGQAYSDGVAASGGQTPYSWSVSVGSLPSGLSLNSSTGAVTGTPTSAGTSTFTVLATDAGNPVRTAAKSLSIAVINPPPTITTTSLADATNGVAYSKTLSAVGGNPPYTWSLASGSLPSGLSLDSSTGVISGTPSAAPGTFSFVAKVTDSASQPGTKSLSITVADQLSVTTTSLSGGTVGQAYSDGVAASGGQTPYSWSVSVGSLPAGLSLNSSTGAVTGTPTSPGTSTFTVLATDSGSPARTASKQLSIVVVNPLTITTSSLPGGVVGQAYSQSVAASGGSGSYTWTVSVGSLPPGLSLTSGTPNATVSGTPTTTGTFSFTLQVTDGIRTTSKPFSIVVANTAPLTITTGTPLTQGLVGTFYSATFAASGGTAPYSWSRTGGSFPNGLNMTAAGVLSGTPTKQGTYTFTVRVTDSLGATASKTFSLRITRR